MIRRITENQVTAKRLRWKAVANVMGLDIRACRVKIIGKAAPSHRLADIGSCPAASHGIDHKTTGRCEVVKCVCDDPRRDRSRMGNAKGTVVAKGPYIVRRGAKIGAEAIAAAQVLISSVDGLGSGIELGDAALSSEIARLGKPPDRTCLAIEILAPHFKDWAIAASVRPRFSGPGDLFSSRQALTSPKSLRSSEFRRSVLGNDVTELSLTTSKIAQPS